MTLAVVSSSVVLEPDHLRKVVGHFQQHDAFAFDVESVDNDEYPNTRGVPALNRVTWLSMATHGMTAVIPLGHPIGTKVIGQGKEPRTDKNGTVKMFRVPVYEPPPIQMEIGRAFDILRPLFFNEGIRKVGHEITFDLGSVAKYWGEVPPGPYADTKSIMRLLDENTARRGNGLKTWTERIFGVKYDTENVGKCVESHPFDTVAHYSYMDSLYTWLLYQYARPLIDEEDLQRVNRVEEDLISCLVGMRLAGSRMDVPRLENLRGELKTDLIGIEGDIYKAAGQQFNINSPRQRCNVLYLPKKEGGQGLRPWRLTPGGKKWVDEGHEATIDSWSTDAETLKSYPKNTVARTMLNYADTNRMLTGFVNAWLGIEGDKKHPPQIYDGYIYPEYQPHGTVTGRFSGRAPNPQNIYRADTPRGETIRGGFIAPDGYSLVVGDYGQIELVILAHLIGHGKLFDGFWAGIDPHIVTAAGILGKPTDSVTKDERQYFGKTMNFTIVNGGQWRLVAEMIDCGEREAKRILSKHEKEFPEIYAFKKAVFKKARSRRPPHVRSILGRKRRMWDLLSSEYKWAAAAERETFNFLIQGGAADLMKLALIDTDYQLGQLVPDAYVSMCVHDEQTVVTPTDRAEQVRAIMVESMTGPHIQKLIKVPLSVDCNIGQRWSECH